MEADIRADCPLQYASIQISSTQNQYEVFICGDNKIEKMETGVLDHLIRYLPALDDLYAKGSGSYLKLQLPENLHGSRWFTKSTLNKFLNLVSSPELVNKTKAIRDETSQLEVARKFQISVPSAKFDDELVPSDTSRNELLRAMDLRLAALRGELASTFCDVAFSICSVEEITNLAMFSRHFGAAEIDNALHEALNSSLRDLKVESLLHHRSSSKAEESKESLTSRTISSVMPVQYSVSPAKVAQVERQALIMESDDSSDSDGEDQTSAERSRTLSRSGSRRRSASPMRRIQIGRSRPRKPAALTIKSLSYFPARERGLFIQEETSTNEEGPEQQQSIKKSEGDIKRMSVQDRIKIFESKQQDQAREIDKNHSFMLIGSSKSVLRRWSAGMGDTSSQLEPEVDHEDSTLIQHDDAPAPAPAPISILEEVPKGCEEVKDEGDKNEAEGLILEHADNDSGVNHEHDECNEKLTASAVWTQQKEAELNEMFTRMMETKLGSVKPQTGRAGQELPLEQRGRFYDQYKQRRDEKFQGENAGKPAEKQSQFKAMQEILNGRKAAMASSTNNMGKKAPVKQPQQRVIKSVPAPLARPKREVVGPTTKKITTSRASPLPSTRKSWPSAPPSAPRGAGVSPAKISSGLTSGNTPTQRKPQSAGPTSQTVSRPKPSKVEKPQMPRKTLKEASTVNGGKSSKGIVEKKKVLPVSKSTKSAKTRPVTGSSDGSGEVLTKPSFYNKVTKKSSVVPLESKPLRKSSGAGAGSLASPHVVRKSSKMPEEVDASISTNEGQETEQLGAESQKVKQHESGINVAEEIVPNLSITIETETRENGHEELKVESFHPAHTTKAECGLKSSAVNSMDIQGEEEEPTISPMMWVEIEHHAISETELPINTVSVGSSSPRIRHSLSQMLQEESSEADITEWGNAENPPPMVIHKDAPKGLKRLLKFARKSKGDGNSSGWSSPSLYSEAEDDSEDPRASSKRSTDNLLLKAALHAKNFGHQKTFQNEACDKHLDVCNQISGHSGLHKFHDHGGSSAASTAKAARSFFSLSAFRGSKPNETKFR
ncbi:hypothetical protein SAY86_028081 [Trapa natans]|uniref:Uncharacterized protein n=1 Tax=Trapa natans TaxID=22666 RepID=A0AAN7RBW1_TRANT|nr:hypothetical protein SAY86_028081 [Trapa natans]